MIDVSVANLLRFAELGYQIVFDVQGVRAWDIVGDGTKTIYEERDAGMLFNVLDEHYSDLVARGLGRH